MKHLLTYILIGSIALLSYTFPPIKTLSPEKAISKGLYFWENDQSDSAVFYYEMARNEAIKLDDWESWVTASEKMGRAYADQGNFDRGKALLDSAILIGEEKLGKDHLATLNAISQLGIYHQYFGEFQKSLDYHEEVLAILKSNPQTHDTIYAGIYERLALDYVYLEQFEKALNTAKKGVALLTPHVSPSHKKIGILENTIGALESELGNNDEALIHYQRAIDIFLSHHDSTNSRVISLIGNIGNIAMDNMDYQRAYQYFYSTIPYLEEVPVLTQCINYYNLGLVLNLMGEYEQGTMYLEEARQRINIAPDAYQSQQASIEFELARAFTEAEEFEVGMEHLNKSIEIYENTYGPDYPGKHIVLNLMAIILYEQEEFQQSYDHFLEAKDILIDLYGSNHPEVAENLSLIGQALTGLERFEEAKRFLEQSLKVYRQNLPPDHPYLNEVIVEIAIVHRKTGDFQAGIALCEQALTALIPDPIETSQISKGQFSSYWSLTKLDMALSEYAILLLEKYKAEKKVADLEKASVLFTETLTVLDSIRQTYQASSSKSELVREYDYVYEKAVETAYLLYQETQDEKYLETAFSISEKTKSRNLIEAIWAKEAMSFANVPDSILQRELILRREIAYYQTAKVDAQGDSAELEKELQEEYFKTYQAYQQLMGKISANYPNYYELKYVEQSIKAEDISTALSSNQITYNYYWGAENLFIFRHSKHETKVYQVSTEEKIDSLLDQWLNFLVEPPISGDTSFVQTMKSAYQLYSLLLPDLPDSLSKLFIFPDGKLGYLPFESLITEHSSTNINYRKTAWLLKKCPITYAYSANLWAKYRGETAKINQLTYLGFAPRFGDLIADNATRKAVSRTELSRLTFNEKEVNEARKLFGGKAYTGFNAKEDILHNPLKNTILHFATHAIVDQKYPLNSQLFLSDEKAKGRDGILHAYEIYNLQLSSPLVILSACETGTGTFKRGEGIMSLARAFQYAGAKTLVTSLWRADDQASYRVVSDFLKNIKSGEDKSQSLQSAKLFWLSEADGYYSHPFFWAGFVSVGELGVEEGRSLTNVIFWILLGVGLTIGFVIWKHLDLPGFRKPGRSD